MLGENFTFNGIASSTFGVKMVRFGASGFLNETTIGTATLTEIEHPSDFKPHLQKITRTPIEFTKQIALLDEYDRPVKWTELNRQQILGWLFHNEYKPLVFADRPDVVYHVIATSNLTLNTINEQGYVEVTFRTNSPYPWKTARTIVVNGSTAGNVAQPITMDTYMAVDKLYPVVLLERIIAYTGSATLVQVWTTASGAATTIGVDNSLVTTVTKILINAKHKTITNADTGESLYRYKGTTGFGFPYLVPGANTLYVPKGWKATITFQEPILY